MIATAEARDDEMRERIEAHRRERPAGWRTVEEPLDLAGALRGLADDEFAIVDCLSLWVSNLLEDERRGGDRAPRRRGSRAGRRARGRLRRGVERGRDGNRAR